MRERLFIHRPLVLWIKRRGKWCLAGLGIACASVSEQPAIALARLTALKPGHVLLTHTDGLSDATDFYGKRFTHQRFRETVVCLLTTEPDAPAAKIVEHLMWTIRQFAGVRLSTDDITLVVVRVRA
ncbi:MAG: SpoIIE family protein phosphatase [Phycisphaerales bacterium]|nr:SpoIIE family protein phosphatase [Phycisphaerales bacterium]